MRLTLQNVTDRILLVPDLGYTLTVVGPGGDVLAPRQQPASPPVAGGRGLARRVQPGGRLVEDYPLSDSYDFAVPRRYRVIAACPVLTLQPRGAARVTSNRAVLLFAEKADKPRR